MELIIKAIIIIAILWLAVWIFRGRTGLSKDEKTGASEEKKPRALEPTEDIGIFTKIRRTVFTQDEAEKLQLKDLKLYSDEHFGYAEEEGGSVPLFYSIDDAASMGDAIFTEKERLKKYEIGDFACLSTPSIIMSSNIPGGLALRIQEALNRYDSEKAMKDERNKRVREYVLEEEQKRRNARMKKRKAMVPKVTKNPVKWAKLTSYLVNAEKRFSDIYNFETPREHKVAEKIYPLAFTVAAEEARKEKLLGDDFLGALAAMSDTNLLAQFLKPVGNESVEWGVYDKIYDNYIEFRARGYRPIAAMMGAMESVEKNVSEEELDAIEEAYEQSPFFGKTV
jgi:hypothetical protein